MANAGVNVIFELDEDFLAAITIQHGKSGQEIVELKNRLWEQYRDEYKALKKVHNESEFGLTPELVKQNKILFPHIISETKSCKFFTNWLKGAEDFKFKSEEEWKRNYEKSSALMKDITGLDLSLTINVYILNPANHIGRSLGNNTVAWGAPDEFHQYTTIYIWHEILHSYMKLNNISHSIIELATDNELRVRMNGGTMEPLIGHDYLKDVRKILFDSDWNEYLNTKNTNLIEFQEKMLIKYADILANGKKNERTCH